MKSNLLYWNERPARRIRLMENALRKDPFLYHKKKNVISSGFNDSNENDGQNTNQELLFCQDENNKQINFYKNNINSKSSTIDTNAHNYLNYMMKEKKSTNKMMPTEPASPFDNIYDRNNINNKRQINNFPYQESFTPNKYSYNNYTNNLTLSNYRVNSVNIKNNHEKNNNNLDYINFNNNKINDLNLDSNKINGTNNSNDIINNAFSYDENNVYNNIHVNNNNDNINIRSSKYLPKIQSLKGTTDITDQNYYDKVSKQLILQLNKNYMDYNQNLMIKRYSPSPNIGNKFFNLRNDKLALPPGHILNPRYYNLGESRLSSNPIVNPGNRAPIFNHYNNHNHKLKSEFI